MAELSSFAYRPGNSQLHSFDPRAKLVGLALLGAVALAASWPVLVVSGIVIAAALRQAGVGPKRWIADLRTFWVMLLFVFAARVFTGGGPLLVRVGPVGLSAEGLYEGWMIFLRLTVLALAGIGVSAATRPAQIEAAVQALLKPVPLVPEKRAATMLGLLVRFLPEVLHQAGLTREAQRARCAERRKNPVARLTRFVFPVLRRIFFRADSLALAMEARCYSDSRTGPPLSAGSRDALLIAALVCLLAASLL